MSVEGIIRIELVCEDPNALAHFYMEALDCAPAESPPVAGKEAVWLRLGNQQLTLFRPPALGRPYPADVPGWSLAFQHFAIAVDDMSDAMARLGSRPDWTAISTAGPQSLPASSGGVVAFKFRDPEGHPLEFLCAPNARRPARVKETSPFLGIDHSAISVASVARSSEFYENLGFRVKARSLNQGVEQQRLDAIDRPVVEVVALTCKPQFQPHLELLCYQGGFDRNGERLEENDVAATRLVFKVTPQPAPGKDLIRDPDGHFLRMAES